MVVHDLKFGDIAVMQIHVNTICYTDWQFGMFKRDKDNGHDTWKM